MEIRRSYDRLISTMGFPILVRCHLYIDSEPCVCFVNNLDVPCGNFGTLAELMLWYSILLWMQDTFPFLTWICINCDDIPKKYGSWWFTSLQCINHVGITPLGVFILHEWTKSTRILLHNHAYLFHLTFSLRHPFDGCGYVLSIMDIEYCVGML